MSSTTLRAVKDGVWTCSTEVRFLGMRLPASMTVLRLAEGLLIYSPIALTPERRAAVDALGTVTHLYSPNLFHHLRVGDWSAAYPRAKVHAPPGLSRKRPDLRIDRVHGAQPEAAFEGFIDERRIEGCRLEETVLFYRPARTLLVADLVHHVGRPTHAWTKLYTRLMGFYDRVAISRMLRWTAFRDRVAARRSVDELLALSIDTLLPGHGEPLLSGGRDALEEAYRWLPQRRTTALGELPAGCS